MPRVPRACWRVAGFVLVAGAAIPWFTACGRPTSQGPQAVRVFAASSLTAPFAALARAFEGSTAGCRVELHFAGSPQLVVQLREGAAADVFAAADSATMQRVVAVGNVDGAPLVFARNRLAIVVGRGNARGIRGLSDLARPDVAVALGAPEVPVGHYARQALAKAGVAVRSVSDEANVKALVAKVQLGELDAAIVYATDVRGPDVEAVAIDPAHDVVAEYWIARLHGAERAPAAAAFVAFVRSESGRAILQQHGFLLP